MRTVIAGGVLARHDGVVKADLAFEDGRIVEVGESLSREGARLVSAVDCIVLPGGVDMRTSLLPAGAETAAAGDDFYAGTLAAAWGGTTCVVERAVPVAGDPSPAASVEAVRALAEGRAVVDYGVHAALGAVSENLPAAFSHMVARGSVSGELRLDGADGADAMDAAAAAGGRLRDEELLPLLSTLHAAGVTPLVHCENGAMADWLARDLENAGRTEATDYPLSRPPLAEVAAIQRLMALATAAGAPFWVMPLSTAGGLALLAEARRGGLRALAATCPQYLLLDASCYEEGVAEGLKYVMRPPLRRPEDNAALWEGLKNGTIDAVASEHCGCTYEGRLQAAHGNIFRCPHGVPGVETRLPLLFSEGVLRGRLTLSRFVQVTAEAPARLLGLENKGRLEPGADADIVLLDPAAERVLSARTLHQKTDYTPFEGLSVRGWPRHVWLRGQALLEDGVFCGDAACGVFVPRAG